MAAVAQLEQYVPYVILEREKKIVYITGLNGSIRQAGWEGIRNGRNVVRDSVPDAAPIK